MKFAFGVALRFLKSNKGQTILIALGISIGISVQIFIGLLIQGLQEDLINTTIGNSSQITLTSTTDNELISDFDNIISKLDKNKDLKNVSFAVDQSAFISIDENSEPVLLRGFDFERADSIYNIFENVYEGKTKLENYEIIAGKELKDILNLEKGDLVTLTSAKGNRKDFTIAGFYDLKVSNINKSWLLTNYETSMDFLGYDNLVSSIELQVYDVFDSLKISDDISDNLDRKDIKITDWQEENAALLSGLNGQSISSIMIQIFVLIAVILGISSVLAITVMQKSKQIGILKAMGIKDKQASLIFLFEGLLLGFIGSLIGIILGILLILMFQTFALNPDGTPVIAIELKIGFILFSGAVGIVSSIAASLIPARKSSKLNPIEVIKNG